ncbi:DUF2861 family protein [Vibrio maerlii]|uniref:DUF2861 family protein n=1 Tax=Vibrio maerlii TaxID=2231648 RepID=UPI000E3DDDCC|nr:DUF2861 family protein [Vibrio maerlii]
MSRIAVIGLIAYSPFLTADWFSTNNALNKAHESLLTNDLASSFTAMVEVWQKPATPAIKDNLNNLLIQSLDVDCGRTLSNKALPVWIQSLSITRQTLESPGRRTFRAVLNATATESIKTLSFKSLSDKAISIDAESTEPSDGVTDNHTFQTRYNLNYNLDIGLYEVEIESDSGKSWSHWVIISESPEKYTARWTGKDSWTIEKTFIPNRYCSLPLLQVALYDYKDNAYTEKWSQQYESDYPQTIDASELEPQRYILAISMTHERWQGDIVLKDQRVISKSYDLTADKE